ncbi:MAG TPA: DUF3592 domain-containing protein [Candidatus Ozemobacteraceae bacterium]|nr:DUF3592 domain-containing protein [Candidatus Ozemobacteraceae bacterium]
MVRKSTTAIQPRSRTFLFFCLLFILLIPCGFLFFGIREFVQVMRVYRWHIVPVTVEGCHPTVEEHPPDEDQPETRYSLSFTVSYRYQVASHSYSGSWNTGQNLGKVRPSISEVASLTTAFRQTLGDGFSVRVDPDNPERSLVEPSLVAPLILIGAGLFSGAFFLTMLVPMWRNPEPESGGSADTTLD